MPKAEKKATTEQKPQGYKKWAKFDGSQFDGTFASAEENPLNVDQGLLANLNREGLDLRWVRTHCMGQEDTKNIARAMRNGWAPVEKGDIPGIDTVEEGGLQLMARPMAISKKARAIEDAEAAAPVQTKQMQVNGDLPGVTLDSQHPSARNYNRMRQDG
jgi:hypothetical protein